MHPRGEPASIRSFVVFDCAAVTGGAATTAQLFGDKDRGTVGVFESAQGGTLFIDEVGDLDLESQGALLRAIERGEVRRAGDDALHRVNVRTIVATSRDLDKLVEEGRFRDDLFFRLAVGRIELAPLRRRAEDVLPLARHFWRRLTGAADVPEAFLDRYTGTTGRATYASSRTRWLGLPRSGRLRRWSPPARPPTRVHVTSEPTPTLIDDILDADLPFPQARQRVLDAFERAYIERVLGKHGGNVAQAAAASGIARRYFQLIRARQAR